MLKLQIVLNMEMYSSVVRDSSLHLWVGLLDIVWIKCQDDILPTVVV